MSLAPRDFDRGIDAYWAEIRRRSPEVQRREQNFPLFAQRFAARRPPHFDRSDLEDIMEWKHTDGRWRSRALQGLALLSDERIREVTSSIDALEQVADAYRVFKGFAFGVGVASISAILTAARPDRFPVIDVFALFALLEHVPEPWHALIRFDKKTGHPQAHERIYPPFAATCRRLSLHLGNRTHPSEWTPRRVDMALWGIGKQLADAGGRRTSAASAHSCT